MVPLDSGFLFFKLVELDSNESPIFGRDISCVYT